MQHYVHARLQPGRDDDLIAWLEAQPAGGRSEAIRALLRDGLRMRQMESSIAAVVRQVISETLSEVQIIDARQMPSEDTEEIEAAFGNQLDQMLGQFG